MGHTVQRSLVAMVQTWHIETIHPRDLISAKRQQPQSQNNLDVVNRTTQRSSAQRMTAQHTHKTHPKPNQATFQASQDPQLNLFMKCSGLRTRLWGRAQNGRSPIEVPKTAIQAAFLDPSCNQQSLQQRALRSLGGTTTSKHSSIEMMHPSNLITSKKPSNVGHGPYRPKVLSCSGTQMARRNHTPK